jgi:hypothetical protein
VPTNHGLTLRGVMLLLRLPVMICRSLLGYTLLSQFKHGTKKRLKDRIGKTSSPSGVFQGSEHRELPLLI